MMTLSNANFFTPNASAGTRIMNIGISKRYFEGMQFSLKGTKALSIKLGC